jgi:hypothetical protein
MRFLDDFFPPLNIVAAFRLGAVASRENFAHHVLIRVVDTPFDPCRTWRHTKLVLDLLCKVRYSSVKVGLKRLQFDGESFSGAFR